MRDAHAVDRARALRRRRYRHARGALARPRRARRARFRAVGESRASARCARVRAALSRSAFVARLARASRRRAMREADPRFTAWLLDETGIDAESLGANALARAVGARAAATVGADAHDAHNAHDRHAAFMREEWTGGATLPDWAREAYW